MYFTNQFTERKEKQDKILESDNTTCYNRITKSRGVKICHIKVNGAEIIFKRGEKLKALYTIYMVMESLILYIVASQSGVFELSFFIVQRVSKW